MDHSVDEKQQQRLDKKQLKEQKKVAKQKEKDEKELAQLRRFAYGDQREHQHPKLRKTGRFFLKWAFGTGGPGDGRVVANM